MNNCQDCNITHCPVINKNECPINKMIEDTEIKVCKAEDIGRHIVNLNRISRN